MYLQNRASLRRQRAGIPRKGTATRNTQNSWLQATELPTWGGFSRSTAQGSADQFPLPGFLVITLKLDSESYTLTQTQITHLPFPGALYFLHRPWNHNSHLSSENHERRPWFHFTLGLLHHLWIRSLWSLSDQCFYFHSPTPIYLVLPCALVMPHN